MLEKLNPNCIAAQWEVRASMEMVVNSVSPSEFDSSAPPESSEINLQVLSFSLSVQIWIFNWPWLVWLNWISVNSLSSFFTKHPRKVPIEGGSISLRQNRTPKPMTSCCEWMLFNLFGPRFTPLARFICLWFSYCVCLLLFFFFWGKSVCLFFCWDINASHFSPFILSFFFCWQDVLRDINTGAFNDIYHWVRQSFHAITSSGLPGFRQATRSFPLLTHATSKQLFTGLVLTSKFSSISTLSELMFFRLNAPLILSWYLLSLHPRRYIISNDERTVFDWVFTGREYGVCWWFTDIWRAWPLPEISWMPRG